MFLTLRNYISFKHTTTVNFFKAALRMDKHTPKERRKDRVEEVIHEVNIIIIHHGRPDVRA